MALRIAAWTAGILAATALALAAMVVGWRVAGPTESDTELGRVSFEVSADKFGEVDAYVPIADWGIRANAFDAPFELELEIRSLDRKGALDAAGGEREAVDDTRTDLESAARRSVVRGFAFALVAVLLVALVLWLLRSRWRHLRFAAIWVAGVGVVATFGSLFLAVLTFDAKAFTTPAYYGRGPELAQLLAFFERQQDNDRYTATFDNALTNFSAYLADAPRVGEGADRAIFFGSDLHSNLPIISSLEAFVDGEPFILAGDFGVSGSEEEASTTSPRIAALTDEVIAVSGNHDSSILMDELAADGVNVVGSDGVLGPDGIWEEDEFVEVEGLRVAGFSDPLEWEGSDPASSGGSSPFQSSRMATSNSRRRKRTLSPGSTRFRRHPTSSSSIRTRLPSIWRRPSRTGTRSRSRSSPATTTSRRSTATPVGPSPSSTPGPWGRAGRSGSARNPRAWESSISRTSTRHSNQWT